MTDPRPAPSGSRLGLWVRLAVSVLLAALFFVALTPHLDAVPKSFDVAPWAIPAYLGTLVVYALTRTGRWLVLLRPLGPVPTSVGLRVGLAGAMWIALLPFRLGELVRPMLLSRVTPIPLRRALGTIAIERVVDGLVICGLFFATVSGEPIDDASRLHTATMVVAGVFFAALVALAVMGRFPTIARRLVEATVGRVAPRVTPWVAETAQAISEGLAALPRGRLLLGFLAITALYWGVNAFGMWVLARGCSLPITLSQAVTVLAVMNIALLVPGGPAQAGIFQTGVVLGLALFVSPETLEGRGSTYVFLLYVCQLGTIVALGAWAQRSLSLPVWRTLGWSRADDAESTEGDEPSPAAGSPEAERP